jgi:hypothetical protein
MAHVLGEADSMMVDSQASELEVKLYRPKLVDIDNSSFANHSFANQSNAKQEIEIFPADDTVAHAVTHKHWCADPDCEICELRRQRGVKFESATLPSHSGDSSMNSSKRNVQPSIRADSYASGRSYSAKDTVNL